MKGYENVWRYIKFRKVYDGIRRCMKVCEGVRRRIKEYEGVRRSMKLYETM